MILDKNDLIGSSECGEIWGVSGKTVRVWALEGKLPALYTPSGRMKFSRTIMLRMRDGLSVERVERIERENAESLKAAREAAEGLRPDAASGA